MASESTPSHDTPSVLSDTVPVKCGSVTGELYLDKLRESAGNKGSVKCILSNSDWFTPVEFESLGGKGKSKNRRRSIYHEKTSLGIFLAPQILAPLVDSTRALSSSQSRTPSPARTPPTSRVFDPVLAFIKAYRLRGDNVTLKQLVLSTFDPTSLDTAHKLLWDTCGGELQGIGLSYQKRRGSEKLQLACLQIFC